MFSAGKLTLIFNMRNCIFYRMRIIAILFFFLPYFAASLPQEAKVNQRKVDREHHRKEKAAKKEYQDAIKMHEKNQSKETRAMMKKSKKENKKNTPMNMPGGKKCK